MRATLIEVGSEEVTIRYSDDQVNWVSIERFTYRELEAMGKRWADPYDATAAWISRFLSRRIDERLREDEGLRRMSDGPAIRPVPGTSFPR